jgi:hypothetical protein
MRTVSILLGAFVVVLAAQAQPGDPLTPDEVAAAIAAKPATGAVAIQDAGFLAPSFCKAQMPSEVIYTPAGWLNALSFTAKRQYLPYEPKTPDIQRFLTVISYGCANGSSTGPVCQSITRAALLSDTKGTIVIEALGQGSMPQTWQNGFGARAACSSLVSKFSMADVLRLRKGHGEFIIATFDGAQLLKMYTVKEKHLKKLGI